MRLRVGAATSRGRIRELNEDAYGVRARQGQFVVCDGMGGAPAGEVASQIAVDAILALLRKARARRAVSGAGGRQYLPHSRCLADAVRASNRYIYKQAHANPDQAEMGTTVVSAWIRDHVASIAHVGDSRAYVWRDERLELLTRDHSLAEAQHVLVRVLGREPEVEVDVLEAPVLPGDCLLLCSDGLTRMVAEPALEAIIRSMREPQRICDALVEAANRNGGADNITVVVVEVMDTWWRRLSQHWTRHSGAYDAEAHPQI
jgi:PPM family protein phosphatase